jgi:hypothetical protein
MAEIVDLRGRQTAASARPVLVDPSGRRAKVLARCGRFVAIVFLLWLAGLMLAGLGILPAGDLPLGGAVLHVSPAAGRSGSPQARTIHAGKAPTGVSNASPVLAHHRAPASPRSRSADGVASLARQAQRAAARAVAPLGLTPSSTLSGSLSLGPASLGSAGGPGGLSTGVATGSGSSPAAGSSAAGGVGAGSGTTAGAGNGSGAGTGKPAGAGGGQSQHLSRGSSGSAAGHTGATAPGNSLASPGHTSATAPGKSDAAPGHTSTTASGNSAAAPGQVKQNVAQPTATSATPGQSGSAPGQTGTPGHGNHA